MINKRKQIIKKELLHKSLIVDIRQGNKLNKFTYLFYSKSCDDEICTVEVTIYKNHIIINTIVVWDENDRLCGIGRYVLNFIQNKLQKEIRLESGFSATGFYKSIGYENYDKSLFKFKKEIKLK